MLELLQEAVLLSAEKLRINNDLLLNKLNRHSSETRMLTNIMLTQDENLESIIDSCESEKRRDWLRSRHTLVRERGAATF